MRAMTLATLFGAALLVGGCGEDDPCDEFDALVDVRDGQQYRIAAIGEQCWMAENLRHLPQADDTVSSSEAKYYVWGYRGADVSEAKAFVASDAGAYTAYGVLYNWPAAAVPGGPPRGVCPEGWHLPSDAEWETLRQVVDPGGSAEKNAAGAVLKSVRQQPEPHPRWNGPLKEATDEFGFAALPGGWRRGTGEFAFPYEGIGAFGYWWSSTVDSANGAWSRAIANAEDKFRRGSTEMGVGVSVRCIKD